MKDLNDMNEKNITTFEGDAISTGYDGLDKIIGGFCKGELIVIGGRPAMGKTSLALSLLKNIAVKNRIPAAFFSLEMSNQQMGYRLISLTSKINGCKVMNAPGSLNTEEWERYMAAKSLLDKSPIYIDDTPGLSVDELRKKATRLVCKYDVKLIFIDYLQLMNANGMFFNSRQEEVEKIVHSLKELALELDIPIIVTSQVNRAGEGREGLEGKRPQLRDFRESEAIEQDADKVMFIHRPEYYHIYEDADGTDLRGLAQIIVAKNRNGETGDTYLRFKGEYTAFCNISEKE